MRKTLWYSVQNCGDGSAYPTFMESKELCELDQEFMDEGWGEPCVGSIVLESDSEIHVLFYEVKTAEMVKAELEEEMKYAAGFPETIKRLENYLAVVNKLLDTKTGIRYQGDHSECPHCKGGEL